MMVMRGVEMSKIRKGPERVDPVANGGIVVTDPSRFQFGEGLGEEEGTSGAWGLEEPDLGQTIVGLINGVRNDDIVEESEFKFQIILAV